MRETCPWMTRADGDRRRKHTKDGDLHFIPNVTGICAADESVVKMLNR
jgi:hypothetical protein